jgi:hypothetical protein
MKDCYEYQEEKPAKKKAVCVKGRVHYSLSVADNIKNKKPSTKDGFFEGEMKVLTQENPSGCS